MLSISSSSARSATNCQGMRRRTMLRAGTLGALGLSLPGIERLRAETGTSDNGKSVILLWLDGGPSQLETYDPKPDAPSEYRGPWGDIPTNVPGIRFSSMLPLHAGHADKMCVLRSVHHETGDHFAAGHWMLTGRFGATSANKQATSPSVGSCIARLRQATQPGMPGYVGLPAAHSIYIYPGYMGAAWLGPGYDPFQVNMNQKYMAATYKAAIQRPPFLESMTGNVERSSTRVSLLKSLDHLDRSIDQSGMMSSMDGFQQKAVDMLIKGPARQAFDIEQEDAATRDRYGRGPWGHYTLMARRLVESGVRFVTVDMPHWDTHSNIRTGMETRLPYLDMAVDGLMTDLAERNLLDDVLVVIMGEFGRTPRLNNGQPGIPIPGRDHWGSAMSVIMAGGGLRMGQVVGATSSKAEHPISSPQRPDDVLATIYHVLGIDYRKIKFQDYSGRPVPLLDNGTAISEIV
ncbi:MAG: DUF1501 domain-containing protein [Planctomycetaceae bacterium]